VFSEVAVVNDREISYEGGPDILLDGYYKKGGCPVLVFRMANTRSSQICEPDFTLLLLRREPNDDGRENIRMYELEYEINSQMDRVRAMDLAKPFLCLPWTITHRIDERSPLHGLSQQEMKAMGTEVIAILDAIDEACSENFQARWSYTADEIVWNAKLSECTFFDEGTGEYVVRFDKFNDFHPIEVDSAIGSSGASLRIIKNQKSLAD